MFRKLFRSSPIFLVVLTCLINLSVLNLTADAFIYRTTTYETYFVYDIHDGSIDRFAYKVVVLPDTGGSYPGFFLRDWMVHNYYENGQYVETLYTEDRQTWVLFPKGRDMIIGSHPGTRVRDTLRRYDYIFTDPAAVVFQW